VSRPHALILAVALLAVLAASWQRARAVERLPPDYDELVYLPIAYRYAEMMDAGRWSDVSAYRENFEHPPQVKLLYAMELRATRAPEPDWKSLRVGRPLPEPAVPAFRATRWLSAVAGILQVALLGLIHPLGALLLAFDPYHAKYTSQAYLEGIPGFFAILAVFAFERSRRMTSGPEQPFRLPWLAFSGVLLGLAAAGKYPYGMVVGLAFLPFLVLHARAHVKPWATLVLSSLLAFFVAHPALWSAPLDNLWASITFHWGYSHSPHVVRAGLPWYQPLYNLTHAEPLRWHKGVFATGLNAWVLLPLAAVGAPATVRQRPVWAAWAGVGLVFLFLWPTKWPQYLLLILPPLCICAGRGVSTLGLLAVSGFRRLTARP